VKIRRTLGRPGQWPASATKRGRSANAMVLAHPPASAQGGQQGGNPPSDQPSTFSGSCEFAGTVAFSPPLSNNPQTVDQQVEGPGKCSGTFVDGQGHSHELDDSPATYLATGRGEGATCGQGMATGSGRLVFEWDDIPFTLSERRAGGNVIASLTGANSGSATATGGVSRSEDPVEILQKCGSTGLERVGLEGRLTTPDYISG
jgi:hypothetical protein